MLSQPTIEALAKRQAPKVISALYMLGDDERDAILACSPDLRIIWEVHA